LLFAGKAFRCSLLARRERSPNGCRTWFVAQPRGGRNGMVHSAFAKWIVRS